MYVFYKDGEQIQSLEAKDLKEAEEKSGLTVDEDKGISYAVINTTNGVNTTTKRKPRADKGQHRGTVKDTKVAKKDTRKRPEYFVFYNGNLTPAISREKAIEVIDEDKQSNPRVIMGHEITFTRSVKFHF